MHSTPGTIVAEPGEHVVLTGPITGIVTTADGTTYDVSDVGVAVSPAHADEVAHLIGSRYAAEGHPDDPPEETFVYEVPEAFVDYTPHPDNTTLVDAEQKGA